MSNVSFGNVNSVNLNSQIIVSPRFSSLQNTSSKSTSLFSTIQEKISSVWLKILSCLVSFFCCKSTEKKSLGSKDNKYLPPKPKPPVKPDFNPDRVRDLQPPRPKPPKPIPEKPVQPPSKQVDHFKKVPSAVTTKMLSFLDAKDVIAFGRTSRLNAVESNREGVWKRLIARDIKPKVFPDKPSKEKYRALSEKIAFVGLTMIPGIKDLKPFTYTKGITTMGDLKRRISKATGIPLNQMKVAYIGAVGKRKSQDIPDGSEGWGSHLVGSSGFGNNKPENDDILCSDVLTYYGYMFNDLVENDKGALHLYFSFNREEPKR